MSNQHMEKMMAFKSARVLMYNNVCFFGPIEAIKLVSWFLKQTQYITHYMIDSQITKHEAIHNYFNQYEGIVRGHAHETQLTSVIEKKIKKQIDDGNIQISDKKDSCSNIRKLNKQIQSKKQKLNKGLQLLNMNLNQSAYFKRKSSNQSGMDRSTRSLKKIDVETARQQFVDYRNEQIKSFQRLKDLKKMKQQLMKQRQFNQLIKKVKEDKKFAEMREQQLKSQHQKRVEKLNKISQRIKKLQQNRVQRIEKLKSSIAKSSPTLPKYKLMRYQFDTNQIEFELKEKEKFHCMMMNKMIENDIKNIKQHQNEYTKMKKQRQKSISLLPKNKIQDLVERQKSYNKLGQNPQKIESLKKKNIRIKQYQNQTNQNRKKIKIDPKIGKQIQAAKDKSKHPFKYHYLKKKKQLTDIEIYENFNHFNFNSDPTQIGKAYLQQIKAHNNQSRVSLQSKKRAKTNESQLSERRNYKNYLQESKRNAHKKSINQVDYLIKLHGQKSKVLEILQKKANGQTESALKKITKLKAPNTYSKTLAIQQEIDSDFIDSIKTKLKCLQIK